MLLYHMNLEVLIKSGIILVAYILYVFATVHAYKEMLIFGNMACFRNPKVRRSKAKISTLNI